MQRRTVSTTILPAVGLQSKLHEKLPGRRKVIVELHQPMGSLRSELLTYQLVRLVELVFVAPSAVPLIYESTVYADLSFGAPIGYRFGAMR